MRTRIATVLSLAAVLSGCGLGGPESRFLRDDPALNHPISVERVQREHRIEVDGRGNLLAGEGAWTGIAVDHARRGWGPVVVAGNQTDVRNASRLLVNAGVPLADIRPQPERGGPRGVVVTYHGAEANTSPCGAFASDAREWAQVWNAPSSEWGCATQANLAAMISDPRDLVRRRGSEQPYGAGPGRATGRVQDWGLYERPAAPTANAGGAGGGGR